MSLRSARVKKLGQAAGFGGSNAVTISGSPSGNRTAIQAALDAGGRVVIDAGGAGGDVLIDGPVYVGDNTTFVTAPGTILKGAPNTGGKLIVGTKPLLISPTAVTVTWTAGTLATITWAGHGLGENDAIVLQGANEPDWWEVVRVASVTDANTITVRLPAVPSAAPTGTVTARRCVRNVRWDLAVDYNGPSGNLTVGQGYDRMATIAAFVADATIVTRAVGPNLNKYGLMLAGTDNVSGECIALPRSHSDTLKVYGPAVNTVATAEGCGPEDCLTMQALEGTAWLTYMPCRGNMRGITLRPRAARVTTAGSGPVVIYADNSYVQEGVIIDGGDCRAMAGTTPAVALLSSSGQTATLSKLRDLTLRDTYLSSAGNAPFMVGIAARRVRLQRPRFGMPADNSKRIVLVGTNSVIDEFVIEDASLITGAWPDNGSTAYAFEFGGTNVNIGTIVFRRVSLQTANNLRGVILNSNATVKTVIFEDCNWAGFDNALRIQTAGVTVIVRGGSFAGNSLCNFVGVSGRVILQGSPTLTNMGLGIARSDGASTVVDIEADSAPTLAGTSQLFSSVNGGKVNVRSDRLSVDIGATGVNKAAGNRAFNTGTGRGSIPQNVPVVCDGTNWVNVANTAQTF